MKFKFKVMAIVLFMSLTFSKPTYSMITGLEVMGVIFIIGLVFGGVGGTGWGINKLLSDKQPTDIQLEIFKAELKKQKLEDELNKIDDNDDNDNDND